jgi:hypothetical protein
MYVASLFIWMLHMFHTYIVSVLSGCCVCFCNCLCVFQVFLRVSQMHVSSVPSDFRRMLQVLRLNISKADRVLHLPPRLGVSSSSRRRMGIRCPFPLFSIRVTFRVAWALHGRAERYRKSTAGACVRLLASSIYKC